MAKHLYLGETRLDGKSAYEIWLEEGHTGTKEDFLHSLKGDQGNSGYSGAAGELEVVNNLTQGGATAALSAEMGKRLNEQIAGKCLNKKAFGTLVTGQRPWPGFVVSDFIDIPYEHFVSKIFIWGGLPTQNVRAIDGNGTITELQRKTCYLFDSYTIWLYSNVPAGTQTIRISLYNVSAEARDAMFVGSDIDADYLSWPFMSLRQLPPVSSNFYGGENKEIKAILDAYPEYKDVTGYPSVTVSSKNLFATKDIVFREAAGVSPRYPIYETGYMPVEAGETYTFSVDGTLPFGCQIGYYDSEFNQIASTAYATSQAPANAAYAKAALSSYNNLDLLENNRKIQFEKSAYRTAYEPYFVYSTKKESYPLADKSFATLGDSFTASGSWGRKMAELLNAPYIYNAAVSGSRWSVHAPNQADNLIASGVKPDYILCFMGVNDANNSVSLGNIVYTNDLSEMEQATFSGGVQRTLHKLMNAFPHAVIKIGWTPAGQNYTHTLDVSQYVERLKEIALIYGCQYVETRYCGISQWIDADAVYFEFGTGGGHPNEDGLVRIGEAMARIMSSNQ